MLSAEGTVKLGDFAGSFIDGSPPTVDYEVRSKLPGIVEPDQISDLFALGSALFEMATGLPPYHDKPWREVQGHFKRGRFPKLKSIPELDRIIRKCWTQEYKRAQEVADELEAALSDFDSSSTLVDSTESLSREPMSHDRQASEKHNTLKHAKTPRHKPRTHDLDPDRWDRKRSNGRAKKREDKSGGLLPKVFQWGSYTYSFRV